MIVSFSWISAIKDEIQPTQMPQALHIDIDIQTLGFCFVQLIKNMWRIQASVN